MSLRWNWKKQMYNRIVFVTYRYDPPGTGGEECSKAIMQGAKNAGFDVVIWAGVDIPPVFRSLPILMLIFFIRVVRLKQTDLLIVDSNYHAIMNVSVWFRRTIQKLPVWAILYHYNYWDKKPGLNQNLHRLSEKILSHLCTYIITISEFSIANCRALTKSQKPYAIITPYVNNSTPFVKELAGTNNGALKLLHVGHIMPRKNLHTTIHALSMCSDLNWEFNIVGKVMDKKYFATIKKSVAQYNLERKIKFLGRVSSEELDRLYSCSDVFMLVSLMEGFGIVYAEAMRYGLPIIAGNTGAVPEIVHNGQNGILCSPQNANEIRDAVLQMFNEELRNRISQSNQVAFSKFTSKEKFVLNAQEIFRNR